MGSVHALADVIAKHICLVWFGSGLCLKIAQFTLSHTLSLSIFLPL